MERTYTGNRSSVYTVTDPTLDGVVKTVTRADKPIGLTAKEFALLECQFETEGSFFQKSFPLITIVRFRPLLIPTAVEQRVPVPMPRRRPKQGADHHR